MKWREVALTPEAIRAGLARAGLAARGPLVRKSVPFGQFFEQPQKYLASPIGSVVPSWPMRLLGPKSTLSAFRWDLVYLYGGVDAAENAPAVKALAPTVLGFITKLKAERSDFEDTENAWMVALALRTRRDNQVDASTVELGGVARATDKAAYAVLFPTLNPSQVTKLALAEQLKENHRIQKELDALPADHDLRLQYGAELLAEIEALENADKAVDEADVALALSGALQVAGRCLLALLGESVQEHHQAVLDDSCHAPCPPVTWWRSKKMG